jgi:DNA-directed RNA polymerase sigma subunit (sigma70/sigma32)
VIRHGTVKAMSYTRDYLRSVLGQYQSQSELHPRNVEIFLSRTLDRETYRHIGRTHGITCERVRQIVAKYERIMRHWTHRSIRSETS